MAGSPGGGGFDWVKFALIVGGVWAGIKLLDGIEKDKAKVRKALQENPQPKKANVGNR
jgi:hypothetical protein